MLRILCKICLLFVTKFFKVSTSKMSLTINFYATPKAPFQYAALLLSSHITFEVPKPDFDIYPIFLSFFLFIHPSTVLQFVFLSLETQHLVFFLLLPVGLFVKCQSIFVKLWLSSTISGLCTNH